MSEDEKIIAAILAMIRGSTTDDGGATNMTPWTLSLTPEQWDVVLRRMREGVTA